MLMWAAMTDGSFGKVTCQSHTRLAITTALQGSAGVLGRGSAPDFRRSATQYCIQESTKLTCWPPKSLPDKQMTAQQ